MLTSLCSKVFKHADFTLFKRVFKHADFTLFKRVFKHADFTLFFIVTLSTMLWFAGTLAIQHTKCTCSASRQKKLTNVTCSYMYILKVQEFLVKFS